MKVLFLRRKMVVALALSALAALLISCVPNADEPIISPQLGALLAAREAGEAIAVLPTPVPVLIATLTEEQIYAEMPEDVMAAIAAADPGRAETLALANGCVGCHSLDPNQQMTGPSWYHAGDKATNRIPGESPAFYLYQSITDPNAFLVPGFPGGVMPADFAQKLSAQDLADLIAYLLAQRQE